MNNTANQRTLQTFTDAATYGYTYDRIGQLTNTDSSVSAQDRKYVYDAAWNLNFRTNNTTAHSSRWMGRTKLTSFAASHSRRDSLELDSLELQVGDSPLNHQQSTG